MPGRKKRAKKASKPKEAKPTKPRKRKKPKSRPKRKGKRGPEKDTVTKMAAETHNCGEAPVEMRRSEPAESRQAPKRIILRPEDFHSIDNVGDRIGKMTEYKRGRIAHGLRFLEFEDVELDVTCVDYTDTDVGDEYSVLVLEIEAKRRSTSEVVAKGIWKYDAGWRNADERTTEQIFKDMRAEVMMPSFMRSANPTNTCVMLGIGLAMGTMTSGKVRVI